MNSAQTSNVANRKPQVNPTAQAILSLVHLGLAAAFSWTGPLFEMGGASAPEVLIGASHLIAAVAVLASCITIVATAPTLKTKSLTKKFLLLHAFLSLIALWSMWAILPHGSSTASFLCFLVIGSYFIAWPQPDKSEAG